MPSIERALTVLEFLAHSRRGFSISEMSRRLGIPKSSTHLILTTLERRGFLQKNTQTSRYCFGLQLLSLSRSALENLDLREEAKPFFAVAHASDWTHRPYGCFGAQRGGHH